MNKFTIFLWLATCLGAHAQTPDKHGVKTPLGDTYIEATGVAPTQQRLVFYRSPTARQPGVVGLQLNGKYFTSLQRNAYAVVCLDSSTTQVRALSLLPMDQTYLEVDTQLQLIAKPSDSTYIRVSEHADGRPRLDIVSAHLAAPELQTTRQQMHTISRMGSKRECKVTYNKPKPSANPTLTLSTDVWFTQRKTELIAITPQSRRELDALIQKLDTQYKQAASIRVQLIGHADDTEDAYQNEQLAKLRAQTVSLYLLSNGLSPQNIVIEWSAALNQSHPEDGYHNRRAELTVFIHLD
jgi:outer membrane protein OmpA-like peptidoglycan-associated protein